MNTVLTNDNFNDFAKSAYNSLRGISEEEMLEDLKRIVYVKRLFTRYIKDGELRKQLILNHLILLYNVFGKASVSMLFFKIEKRCWSVLATFIRHQNNMPKEIEGLEISPSDIKSDPEVEAKLKEGK